MKITKGQARFSEEYNLITVSKPGRIEGSKTICTLNRNVSFEVFEGSDVEWKENAELIVDAFNTTNECDLLPSELLKQRNKSLSALKMIASMMEAWENSDQESFNKYCNIDAHIAMESAIKNATGK